MSANFSTPLHTGISSLLAWVVFHANHHHTTGVYRHELCHRASRQQSTGCVPAMAISNELTRCNIQGIQILEGLDGASGSQRGSEISGCCRRRGVGSRSFWMSLNQDKAAVTGNVRTAARLGLGCIKLISTCDDDVMCNRNPAAFNRRWTIFSRVRYGRRAGGRARVVALVGFSCRRRRP